MSDFLEHKKTVDLAALVARIPEKWRMPIMIGGPALLVVLTMPLLFRDEKVHGIDRNTVASLSKTLRSADTAAAARETALDAALKAKLAAEQPAPAPAAAAPAPVPVANAASPSAATDAPPAAPPSYLAGSGATAQNEQPTLKTSGPQGGSAGSGGAVAAGPGRPAAKPVAMNAAAPAAGPAPKIGLKAFDWRGPGAGAGREALAGGTPGTSATANLNFQSGGQAQSSAFVSGAGAYGRGAAAAAPSGGPSASAGSLGTANTVGMGGGSGASSPAAVDTSANDKMMKQCKTAQDKYQPKVDEQNKALNSYEKYRSDHDCKNIGCYNCNSEQWNYMGGIYRSWCSCASNRCNAQKACSNINNINKDWQHDCPMMGSTKMDCSQT